MKLNSIALGAVVLVIIFGGIAVSAIPGWWQTESRKQPAMLTGGEAAGQPDPADIRGSYTFGDIESAFGVPASELASAFALPEGTDARVFQVKSLETLYAVDGEAGYEIGTGSVRLFTAFYTGLPIDLTVDNYLLAPAGEILSAQGKLDAERFSYLQNHLVPIAAVLENESQETLPASENPQADDEPSPSNEEHSSSDGRIVNGQTSFADLIGWGVDQEQIEEILGGQMPNHLVKVKDFCVESGLSFSEVKAALQAEVDNAR